MGTAVPRSTTRPRPAWARATGALFLLSISTGARAEAGACACSRVVSGDYGSGCGHWDSADEEPWCRVAEGVCGAATFESVPGEFWSHQPCADGSGATPAVTVTTMAQPWCSTSPRLSSPHQEWGEQTRLKSGAEGTVKFVQHRGARAIQKHVDGELAFGREISSLRKLSGCTHFPKLLSVNLSTRDFTMLYAGVEVTRASVPGDWKAQMRRIHRTLRAAGIYHNDVWVRNLVVDASGVLTLIDFGKSTQNEPSAMNIEDRDLEVATTFTQFLDRIWHRRRVRSLHRRRRTSLR